MLYKIYELEFINQNISFFFISGIYEYINNRNVKKNWFVVTMFTFLQQRNRIFQQQWIITILTIAFVTITLITIDMIIFFWQWAVVHLETLLDEIIMARDKNFVRQDSSYLLLTGTCLSITFQLLNI